MNNEDKQTILNDFEFLTAIYNQFNPDTPLPAGDPVYVACSEVRGNENIFREIGNKIIRSEKPIYELYTGHRGGGKSTEILRLKKYLEDKGCRVIYFEVDQDIDLNDVSYEEILLSCAKNIIKDLQEKLETTQIKELGKWLKERFAQIIDFGLSEVELEKFTIEQQISLFSKITASIKTIPDQRRQIRQEIQKHQLRFTEILNEFINQAKTKLQTEQKSKLVVIADNLDRIPITRYEDGSNNYERIFIDRASSLKSLHCHIVYTVPISLVYSNRATTLKDSYGETEILPMIMVQDKEGNTYAPGLAKIKEIISKRIQQGVAKFRQRQTNNSPQSIEITIDDLFDNQNTLDLLCKSTGGHLREIMFLMQESINWIDTFPITESALQRAIATSRNTYQNQVDNADWEKLAEVYRDKHILNEDNYRQLLFSRCVLAYRDENTLNQWYMIHPLIKEIDEFKNAVTRIQNQRNTGNLSGN